MKGRQVKLDGSFQKTAPLSLRDLPNSGRDRKKTIEIPTANLHNNLGLAYFKQRCLDGAVAAFNRAIDIAPKLEQAYNNLRVDYYWQGKLDISTAAYKTAVLINPNDASTPYSLGIAHVNQGK